MNIKKIRFIEPGEKPYHADIKNHFVYDEYIRTPSVGLNLLATIVKEKINDTYMYSEAIAKIKKSDVMDADLIFIGIFTFNANRGYKLARFLKKNTDAIVIMGGLHASMNYTEAVKYCDYVLLGEGDESIIELIDSLQNNSEITLPGVAYIKKGRIVHTGNCIPPKNIDIIADRNLVYRYKDMVHYNTIWPQVHASRGCPHNCDYCALVRHFGRNVRTRTVGNVIEDIKQSINFFETGHLPRLLKGLWITDDNFFANREWAKAVLNAIVDNKIIYKFTIQARYEVGFDDEMLELLKKAGFFELAMGIEFIEDEAFENYNKKSKVSDIKKAIRNVQKHGISVRGLFILGADNHTVGVGDRLADFVIDNHIQGVLIQSMYFVPGTPVYDSNKERLLHKNWSKYKGHVVHYPRNISPYELQLEHIHASQKIYSVKRLLQALAKEDMMHKVLFFGEFLWHRTVRAELKEELSYLKEKSNTTIKNPETTII